MRAGHEQRREDLLKNRYGTTSNPAAPRFKLTRATPDRVKSAAPKGGEKSFGVSKADLRKEMSLWQ